MTTLSQDYEKGVPAFTADQNVAAKELAERIKQVAKNIRESSLRVQHTVKVLRESGAIEEMASAIHTAAIASRDTANEISRAASELKESGVIRETATAIEATTTSARKTFDTVNEVTSEIKKTMPNTMSTIEEASKKRSKKSSST